MTEEKKKLSIEISDRYKRLIDSRNSEIDSLWWPSYGFLFLNIGIALGFVSSKDLLFTIIFAIAGILASLVWFLVSKRKLYWQTYWEQRLFDFEREHLPGLDFFGASQQRIQNDVEKNLILHKEMGWLQAIVYKLVLKRPSINNSMLCVPALFVLGWVGLLFSSVKPLM